MKLSAIIRDIIKDPTQLGCPLCRDMKRDCKNCPAHRIILEGMVVLEHDIACLDVRDALAFNADCNNELSYLEARAIALKLAEMCEEAGD